MPRVSSRQDLKPEKSGLKGGRSKCQFSDTSFGGGGAAGVAGPPSDNIHRRDTRRRTVGTDANTDFWINAVAPADIDGVGDLDLAVIGFYVVYFGSVDHRLMLFLNTGPGGDGRWSFTPRQVPLTEIFEGASDLAWGDFDQDGDPDLAVGSEGSTVIYGNDGGALTALPNHLPGYLEDSGYTGAYDLRSLTWADSDNDGDLDLLIPSVFDGNTFRFRTRLLRNASTERAQLQQDCFPGISETVVSCWCGTRPSMTRQSEER